MKQPIIITMFLLGIVVDINCCRLCVIVRAI